jgi:hypothetical protein
MGGGQLAVIVQQTGRPEAPAAVSSVLPPSSARVSRLRLIFFELFFISCSFRIVDAGSNVGLGGRDVNAGEAG